ncbi:riboflavin synthase [Sporosarcina pasteurii]|uniref:Riboflavin synthase n=1 Tax=Sporosarcina pasteurii TaxID=1474 RepID=A0A380C753_SPOPA|nr:riboflavin synthase [Sporosarcina pasteurii]MDS9473062.1 riboflavin synthase [Sporosarcina pasteurii]QBQ04568.1 riboflavin synthase [Sporosarcina pasteurii]SUJ14163.1 Riboflavin synthase alpha chain [Sporosarcina pasteurii]
MFTGIVEEIGTIQSANRGANSLTLQIQCTKVLEDVNKGDSIAVNGVCLTVKDFTTSYFTADVMPETVKATTIHSLQVGSRVNLERAMAANGRFGGHFVSGHVDGTGEIVTVQQRENAIYMEINIAPELLQYFIQKGSVTVDGTSLTVFDVTDNGFVISLIPVTQADSIIGQKRVGDIVNVECDMLAKYIERLLSKKEDKQQSAVTMSLLAQNGFLN